MNMPEENQQKEDKHFTLHIGPAETPKEQVKLKKVLGFGY